MLQCNSQLWIKISYRIYHERFQRIILTENFQPQRVLIKFLVWGNTSWMSHKICNALLFSCVIKIVVNFTSRCLIYKKRWRMVLNWKKQTWRVPNHSWKGKFAFTEPKWHFKVMWDKSMSQFLDSDLLIGTMTLVKHRKSSDVVCN